MKIIISLVVVIGLLLAGIYGITRIDIGTAEPPPMTAAPPAAPSAGQAFDPPPMPDGPYEAESLVISYNLSEVLRMPVTEHGVWGGQQSRIARLGDDLYLIFGVGTVRDGEDEFVLYRYCAALDKWIYFYKLRSYEIPGLHVAANGRVYVAYVHARGLGVLEYNPATDKIAMQDSGFGWPAEHERDHWSYMSTGISQGRYIWFLGCGNIEGKRGRPGGFAVYSYDTAARAFNTMGPQRHLIDYRHEYNYVLDNRDGGITIAGERAIFWDVSEWEQPAGSFDAIFDEINFWTFKNGRLSDIHRVDKALQGKSCPVPNSPINYAGDAFLDLNGYLHILYTLTCEKIGGRTQLWHAVYKDGVEVKKEGVLDGQYSVRFAEDTAGQLYLLAIPYGHHTVKLFEVDAQHELRLAKEITIPGDGYFFGLAYAGMAATVPRTGTAPADFVDVIYPNIDRTNWIYFRLQLS